MSNSTVFQVGVRVRATHDPKHDAKYAPEDVAQRYKCTGKIGVVYAAGRSVEVEYDDGRRAWWEPIEVSLVLEQPKLARGAGFDVNRDGSVGERAMADAELLLRLEGAEHPAVTLLREIEWIRPEDLWAGAEDCTFCACCHREQISGHAADCRLAAILAGNAQTATAPDVCAIERTREREACLRTAKEVWDRGWRPRWEGLYQAIVDAIRARGTDSTSTPTD